MSGWNSLLDFAVLARARWAQNRGSLEKALQLVQRDPRPGSRYSRLLPLYRLTLMLSLGEPRRSELARSILAEDWPVTRPEEVYFDAYRRFVCGVALGNIDDATEAAGEMRHIDVDPFIANTLRRVDV